MACNHNHSSSGYPALNSSPGAKWIKNLTKDRLGGFNGGHYNDVNLGSVLFTHRLDNPENVKLKVYVGWTVACCWKSWLMGVQMERAWSHEAYVRGGHAAEIPDS
jgi:hypothetical protein